MNRLLRDVQITFLTHKIDYPSRDRVRSIFGNDFLSFDYIRNEQAKRGQLLIDRQLATVTIDEGRWFCIMQYRLVFLFSLNIIQNPQRIFATTGCARVVELEDLGREGKRLRAALAIATGRTSMPAVFVNSRAIGGYTDGEPAGDEALCLAGSPGLKQLIEGGTFQGLLKSALASRDNRTGHQHRI